MGHILSSRAARFAVAMAIAFFSVEYKMKKTRAGNTRKKPVGMPFNDALKLFDSAGLTEPAAVLIIPDAEGRIKGRKSRVAGRVSTGRFRPIKAARRSATDHLASPPAFRDSTIELLAAIAHPQRAKILRIVAGGPATYARLYEATRLAAGPMYHHLRPLLASRCLMQPERNRYEITTLGRLMLAVLNGLDQWRETMTRNGE